MKAMKAMNLKAPKFLLNKEIDTIVTLDFETFYGKGYTLSRMSTSLYIFDDRFKVHGLGININGITSYYDNYLDIKDALSEIDWKHAAVLGHHIQFDGLILSYHFGIEAKYYLDTLSMARPVLQNKIKKLDLNSICEHYKIPGKLDGLEDTKDKVNLSEEESTRLGIYCKNDVDITMKVFLKLITKIPPMELDLIDITVKMYTNPRLIVDEKVIDKEIKEIQEHKQDVFDKAKLIVAPQHRDQPILKILRSNNMLAETMEFNEINPPTKISPATEKETYAFARTDLDFQKFEQHENPVAQLLFKARILSKSDIAYNKAVILKKFAEAGCCPIYLNYWKAQTGRWSGGDKWNPQNLPRGGAARISLTAPNGYVLLVSDLSQIEIRMSAWVAGQQNVLDIFNSGGDIYIDMASKIYDIPIEEVTKHQRMVGKVTVLGCGYGCGANTFDNMLKAGMMGPKINLPFDEVKDILKAYRDANPKIVDGWSKAGDWLDSMCKDAVKRRT